MQSSSSQLGFWPGVPPGQKALAAQAIRSLPAAVRRLNRLDRMRDDLLAWSQRTGKPMPRIGIRTWEDFEASIRKAHLSLVQVCALVINAANDLQRRGKVEETGWRVVRSDDGSMQGIVAAFLVPIVDIIMVAILSILALPLVIQARGEAEAEMKLAEAQGLAMIEAARRGDPIPLPKKDDSPLIQVGIPGFDGTPVLLLGAGLLALMLLGKGRRR